MEDIEMGNAESGEAKISLKINDKKILTIKEVSDIEKCNEIVQILQFSQMNEDKFRGILKKLNLDNFPNVFVITAHLNTDIEREMILNEFKKFKFSREFLLHTKFRDEFKSFVNRSGSGLIKMHESEAITKLKALNIKASRRIETCQQFFLLLNYRKRLVHEVDFSDILTFFGLDSSGNQFLYLKKAIDNQNEQMVRLLALYVNSYDVNLFSYALESRNDKIIDGIWVNYKSFAENFEIWCEMRQKVAEKNCVKMIFELQKCETNFYETSVITEVVESSDDDEQPKKKIRYERRKENYLLKSSLEELHQNIKDGNFAEVLKFNEKFPNFKFCFLEGKSALEVALESKKLELYSLLLVKKFLCEKNIEEKVKKLYDQIYQDVRSSKLLDIVASKCEFFESANNLKVTTVRQWLEPATMIEGALEMLTILAQSNVTIVLNINDETSSSNPIKIEEKLFGSKRLLIAQPVRNETEFLATFLHEVTHYVCELIYENGALPYCKDDKEKEQEFDEILQQFKLEHNTSEEIIADIFKNYDNTKAQKAELIARVPEMLATYQNKPTQLEKVKTEYSKLFEFYHTKFLNDIQPPNVYRMIKLNNDFQLLNSIEKSKFQVETKNELDLSEKRILFVSKIPQLVLSRIVQKMKSTTNFKAKNIFVGENKPIFYEELHDLMENSCVERIVANVLENNNSSNNNLSFFEILDEKIQYILVVNEKDSNAIERLEQNFKRQDINFEWKDLSESSQNFLLQKQAKYQNLEIKIEEFFDEPEKSITVDALAVLCGNSEISINCDLSGENLENFWPVKILKKSSDFYEDFKFIEIPYFDLMFETRTAENFQNIVLISDASGSGKTFLLRKLCDELKNTENKNQSKSENQNQERKLIFSLFLSLENHLEELKEFTGKGEGSSEEQFIDFVAKMAKLDGLTKAVFAQKFSKGQTVIFFDAFDEVYPTCKKNAEKLFELFQKTLEESENLNEEPKQNMDQSKMDIDKKPDRKIAKNQIFISIRTHLEADFEQKFDILSYKIKTLSKQEQIEFLTNSWRFENTDSNFIKKCVEKLVKKIAEAIPNIDLHPEFYDPIKEPKIGLLMILAGLADIYRGRVDETFEEDIKDLSLYVIYDKFVVEKSMCAFHDQFGYNNYSTTLKTTSSMQIHEFFAFKVFSAEKLATSQGIYHSKRDWPFEEIARFKMITFDENKNPKFVHLSYAEYFIALQLWYMLKTIKNFTNDQMSILVQIFNDEFSLARQFLDSMLETFEDSEEDIKVYHSNGDICEIFSEMKYLVDISADEGLFCIFDFLMSLTFKFDIEIFRKIVFRRQKRGNFLEIFIYARNAEKVEKLLDKIFEAGIPFEDLLDEVFPLFAKHSKSCKIFEVFWTKCESFIKSEEKLKEIFTEKDKNGQNLLQNALTNENETEIFQFLFDLAISKIFNRNLEEFEDFLFKSDSNILFENLCEENLQFLFAKFGEIFGRKKIKEILGMKNKNGQNLMTSKLSKNAFLWQIFEENLSREEICELLQEKDENGQNFLHKLASEVNSIETLKTTAQKLQNLCFDESLRKMLSEKDENNILPLHKAFEHKNAKNLSHFLSIYEQNFTENEIKEFLKMKDENFYKVVLKRMSGDEKVVEKLKQILAKLRIE